MEADTLTTIDTTARLDSTAYPDSTILMLKEWDYAGDTLPLVNFKCWLQDSIQLFHQRNSSYFTRHDGVFRADKVMSESMLLALLLFETLLVAYLIKNGIKFINKSIRNVFISDGRSSLSDEVNQKGIQFRQYLWVLSIVVFALFAPLLFGLGAQQIKYDLNSWMFLRIVLYVGVYFSIKYLLYKIIGGIFFSSSQTKASILASKTTISFYALSLTPILICSEIGIQMQASFIITWVVIFFSISKIWLIIKLINIFSIRIGLFLYLIMYLCTLEIMPILLFYKGLFLF